MKSEEPGTENEKALSFFVVCSSFFIASRPEHGQKAVPQRCRTDNGEWEKRMRHLRMAVIGVGHLGKEHARILAGLPDVELVGVADVNLAQAQAVARGCGTRAFADYWPLLNLVEAAAVVVPTTCHHAVAAEFLRRGIHPLVEKPLTPSPEEAESLVELSRRHGALLQVGHIERFNPAF